MFLTACRNSLRKWISTTSARHTRTKARPKSTRVGFQPRLEVLEDRCLPSSYNVVDLGSFNPGAINNNGVIAGTGANGHAALWQNGTTLDLGTLGGAGSNANDLNNLGQAAGRAQNSSGYYQAFFWNSTPGMQAISSYAGVAYGINDAGQVVGNGADGTTSDFFIWDPTHGLTNLGSFGGGINSAARAINQAGQVAGWVDNLYASVPTVYGYIWDSGSGSLTRLRALPGYGGSRAYDINTAGEAIGDSGYIVSGGVGGRQHFYKPAEACLWQNGTVTDLHMASASAINNLGQVVGGKYLWRNGTLTDVNTLIDPTSGWVITATSDINDAGQIVGQGTLNGVTHYFLLNPVAADPSGTVGFAVSGFPSPTTAGVAGSFTVTALNSSGVTVTGYTGTVYFTSSDAHAGLPSAYTFTTADAGVHTFSATLKTAGTQSLTVTDGTYYTTGSQGGITVQAAAVSKLVVAGFPPPNTAGVAASFSVTPEDAYGNVVSGYTGTIHFTSSDPQAVLPANYTFSGQSVQTFSATLKTAGPQSITATDIATASITGTDSAIYVNPAAASRLVITGPSNVFAGSLFSITVTAYDPYGNIATGYLGTVTFMSSDGTATLPANYTFATYDQGVHTFTGIILKKKGTQTITVTDTLNSTITGSLSVSVG